MKIYLVSAAGYPNYGDELILKNWVIFLQQTYPAAEIWVDVPYPTNIAFYFRSNNVVVTDALWRLLTDSPCDTYEEFFETIDNRINHLGSPRYDLALSKLREIDVFHIVGGGYINALWKRNIGVVQAGIAIKKLTGCKSYITGAGLVPSALPEYAIIPLLQQYDFVEVRDSTSATEFSTELGYDDAYLNLVENKTGFEDRAFPQVMVCIQRDQLDEVCFYKVVSALEHRIMKYYERNISVGYIEAIPGGDRLAYSILQKYIPERFFFNSMDTILHGLPMTRGQRWYSTRFHHHLVASLNGCAGVALSSSGYYDVKHSSLLANGTGWSYWNIMSGDPLPYPKKRSDFINKSVHIIESKRATARKLYKIVL